VAGLSKGDRIVKADGHPVRNTIDLYQVLAARPAMVSLGVEHGGVRDVPLVLSYDAQQNANLGLTFAATAYRSTPLRLDGAFLHSVKDSVETVTLTVKGIGLLFQGVNLRNAVAGPSG